MITVELQGDQAILLDFAEAPSRVSRAAVRAMNRGIASARTLQASSIAKDMGLKVGLVRDAIRLREATLSSPEAIIGTSLKKIPLIAFHARGPRPSRGRGRGVTYRIGGQGQKRIPDAFITTVRTAGAVDRGVFHDGHEGVFRRVGKDRLPIKQRYGPSLGHVFAKYRAAARYRAEEIFTRNFDHEMDFRATGALD